jgi:hypothetical protein
MKTISAIVITSRHGNLEGKSYTGLFVVEINRFFTSTDIHRVATFNTPNGFIAICKERGGGNTRRWFERKPGRGGEDNFCNGTLVQGRVGR